MYVLLQFESDGSKNKEFNLNLDHNINILGYLTTKIRDDQLLSDIPSLEQQLGLLSPGDGATSNQSVKVEDSKEETIKAEDSKEETVKAEDSKEETVKAEDSEEETVKTEDSTEKTNKEED